MSEAQAKTVETLLLEPQMLGELGGMRRKLQVLHSEAETLRGGLQQLCDSRSQAAKAADIWRMPRPKSPRKLRTASRVVAPATPAAYGGAESAQHGATSAASPMVGATPLRELLALPVPATPADARQAALEREHERRAHEISQDALRLQIRLVLPRWRAARRVIDRQSLLLRQLSEQRNRELEAAAGAKEAQRRGAAEVRELLTERETWRKQSAEQADVIAAAIAAAARTHDEHEDEVAVLSEKLRQVVEESDGLSALCDSQAQDLEVLSNEVVRLMQGGGAGLQQFKQPAEVH